MTATINASTSSGIVTSADTSGALALQSNGTTKLTVDSTGAYGQLVSGTTVATTSGTSITFTGIPSWAKRITLMFNAVSSTGSSIFQVQIGAGSVTTTGYNSNRAGVNGGGAFSANATSGYIFGNSGTGQNSTGTMTLATLGSNIWVESHAVLVTSAISTFGGGGVTLGGTLDRVVLTTVGGTDTFNGGSINILYEG